MVRRGEFLERAVVIPTEAGFLEGLFHGGQRRPGLLLAPPHPERGGGMDVPAANEIAWAATRTGHPSLRFNYRGVGASGGSFEQGAGTLGDTRAAAAHLEACLAAEGRQPALAAVGLGYGAEMVARLALERPLDPLVLVSPEAACLPGLGGYSGQLVLVIAAADEDADRQALTALARAAVHGRFLSIPTADAAWRRGLLELGRAVCEVLSPPIGRLIDLDGAD